MGILLRQFKTNRLHFQQISKDCTIVDNYTRSQADYDIVIAVGAVSFTDRFGHEDLLEGGRIVNIATDSFSAVQGIRVRFPRYLMLGRWQRSFDAHTS
jgi:hypothetical protein